MSESRQVRRANERRAAKIAAHNDVVAARVSRRKAKKMRPLGKAERRDYPSTIYAGFKPRGKNYRRDKNYGCQEAARRTGIPN